MVGGVELMSTHGIGHNIQNPRTRPDGTLYDAGQHPPEETILQPRERATGFKNGTRCTPAEWPRWYSRRVILPWHASHGCGGSRKEGLGDTI